MCDSFKCVNWEWRGGSGLIIFKVSSWNEPKKIVKNSHHKFEPLSIAYSHSSCYYFCLAICASYKTWYDIDCQRFDLLSLLLSMRDEIKTLKIASRLLWSLNADIFSWNYYFLLPLLSKVKFWYIETCFTSLDISQL